MDFQDIRGSVLTWYDTHGRDLPWRHKGAAHPNPYHVWLSEIMLQQTTVTAVKPYFEKFITLWPRITDLAAASRDNVMVAWAGLGYYSRARNLHACAVILAEEYNGLLPHDIKALKSLPGIGDYTSAAIRAIAFNKPAFPMDGNIERIMARVFAIHTPLPKAKAEIKKLAAPFFDENHADHRHSDFVQALMDIGAGICTPKAPKCTLCPFQSVCVAYKEGTAETLPIKAKKRAVPQKYGTVYIITNDNNEILIHHRPDQGLLAGMMGLPTSPWDENKDVNKESPYDLKDVQYQRVIKEKVKHVFTHFSLTLTLKCMTAGNTYTAPNTYTFSPLKTLRSDDFPSVFQKCLHLAFDHLRKSM